MNLHNVVSGAITAVNPFRTFAISNSTGYTTGDDGARTPTYTTVSAEGQMQALSGRDIRQLEGLNLNGTLRTIYFNGEVDAVVRAANKGGDVITDDDANVWLVNQVLEQWPDWCKVVVTLQDDA